MAIPELVKRNAEKLLQDYCNGKVPPCVRQQVRLNYRIEEDHITLLEERALASQDGRWRSVPIAQFRFNHELGQWSLHFPDRYRNWHFYLNTPPTLNLAKLLHHLDEDPFAQFWG